MTDEEKRELAEQLLRKNGYSDEEIAEILRYTSFGGEDVNQD